MNRSLLMHVLVASALLVLALVSTVGTAFLLSSTENEAVRLATEIEAREAELLRVAAAKAALPLLVQAESDLAEHTIQTNDIVPFLEGLEKLGAAQGADVEVLSVTGGQGTPPQRLSLSLKVTGSYDAVVRTIGRIEYGPYDTQLTTLTLDSGVTEEGAKKAWTAAAIFSIGARTATH
jgi:Tfp pilus assembly protein PilO